MMEEEALSCYFRLNYHHIAKDNYFLGHKGLRVWHMMGLC